MRILAPAHSIVGRLRPVSSKSISNRALLLEALSAEACALNHLSEADDTALLTQLLRQIAQAEHRNLHAKNCGTAYRFLTAYLCLQPGDWMLSGDERMKLRPIGPLVDALRELGADIHYLEIVEFPPLAIRGGVLNGREIRLNASMSSQFASALMMIGPCLKEGLKINFDGEVGSFPYLEMTAQLMQQFGAEVSLDTAQALIAPGGYRATTIDVEADWSAASYYYELIALSKDGDLFLEGLQEYSLQGDSVIAECMQHFGVESTYVEGGVRIQKKQKHKSTPFAFDLRNCPDLAPALFATCAGLSVPAVFTGTENLRIKESDRAVSLARELEKTGRCHFHLEQNRVRMHPLDSPTPQTLPVFETHGDHRLAMAFAPLACLFDQVDIDHPEVVEKSYPDYWKDLSSLGYSYPNR